MNHWCPISCHRVSCIHYAQPAGLQTLPGKFPQHPLHVWYPPRRSPCTERSTVKWWCDKLQSDKFLQRPFPPLKHRVSWCPVNLINQPLSPQNYQPASFYFTVRFIHFLHISSALQRWLRRKRRWMFHHMLLGDQKKSPRAFRLVGPPLFPFLLPLLYLLSALAFLNAQQPSATNWRMAAGSYAPEPCILQCQGNGSSPFSIPARWHFCLCSINQTAIPAQLHERKMAFERNKGEEKGIFQKMCWGVSCRRFL